MWLVLLIIAILISGSLMILIAGLTGTDRRADEALEEMFTQTGTGGVTDEDVHSSPKGRLNNPTFGKA